MNKEIDYEELAHAIMIEYESDRAESGSREIEKGMKYVLEKYTSDHDRAVIDDMLMVFTGWKLDTLLAKVSFIDSLICILGE